MKKAEQQLSNANPINNATRCASNEGDACACSGIVYYGEKYDRNATVPANGTQQMLSLGEMLKTPYLTKDMSHGGIFIKCEYNLIKNFNAGNTHSVTVKHPKQCFCDNIAKHVKWEF